MGDDMTEIKGISGGPLYLRHAAGGELVLHIGEEFVALMPEGVQELITELTQKEE
jgi:hypothetical protein